MKLYFGKLIVTPLVNKFHYLCERIIEGKRERRIEVMGRQRRRRKQLLDGLKEK
jgi:hypothetical protein